MPSSASGTRAGPSSARAREERRRVATILDWGFTHGRPRALESALRAACRRAVQCGGNAPPRLLRPTCSGKRRLRATRVRGRVFRAQHRHPRAARHRRSGHLRRPRVLLGDAPWIPIVPPPTHRSIARARRPARRRRPPSRVRGAGLTSIPAVRSKRLVVLNWLAQGFEPGRRYPESTVNLILAAVHPDTAALRRYLVDEDLVARARRVLEIRRHVRTRRRRQ